MVGMSVETLASLPGFEGRRPAGSAGALAEAAVAAALRAAAAILRGGWVQGAAALDADGRPCNPLGPDAAAFSLDSALVLGVERSCPRGAGGTLAAVRATVDAELAARAARSRRAWKGRRAWANARGRRGEEAIQLLEGLAETWEMTASVSALRN